MRSLPFLRSIAFPSTEHGPILIALGLAMLFATPWVPAMPVVTAVAILALGATDATLARFRSSPAIVPILLLHATIYVALYGLFIGATLHDAAASHVGVGMAAALDLATSLLPMAATLRHILSGLRQSLESQR